MTRRKASIRRLRFQIADVLADENIFADGQRHGIFQMRADGQDRLWIFAELWRLSSAIAAALNGSGA